MSKELYVSSSPHETKVAVLEDDQLVEVYFQRDTDVGLVGGIYKGRVNRVLPGMQSAFVDIGLERDAFLYVSDFFEDAEEYDKIVTEAEARVTRLSEKSSRRQEVSLPAEAPSAPVERESEESAAAAPATPETPEPAEPASGSEEEAGTAADRSLPSSPPATVSPTPAGGAPESTGESRRHEHRGGRRRRRRGHRFGERKFPPKQESRDRTAEGSPAPDQEPSHTFEILPGESLAKYSHQTASSAPQDSTATAEASENLETDPSVTAAEETANPPTEVPQVETETPIAEAQEPEVAEASAPETLPAPEPEAERSAPASPSNEAAAPPAPQPEAQTKPRPLWGRLVSSVFREPSPAAEEQTGATEEPAAQSETPSSTFESASPEPLTTPEPVPSVESSKELAASPAESSDASSEPSASGPETIEENASSVEASSAEESDTPESSTEPVERTVTLREPNQQPRFAPRRRRGRRGRGQRDFRPRGGSASRRESRPGNNQPVQISELLKEGQEILVQIAKEPLGRKGARITSHIALPGRYLVYMPTVDHIGVSRKIASEEERLRLRNVILENKAGASGGFIVRTAAAGQTEEELKADLKFLLSLWSDIRSRAEATKAPALLHADLGLLERILRDILSPDFKAVWLDSEMEYAQTIDFVSRCQPSLVGHVKLYTRAAPIFEEFGVQAEIEKALKPKVWLKSGGYIVINQTEALVAIDVNTGKYVGKTNRLEDTIVKTNIDAVNEIVRQVRLRDLGGIIVIDFIDMDERRNRNKVVQALEEALRRDRAPTKILSFNDFGLVAVTRKRVKQSLERTLCEPCGYCSGAGWVKSVTTVCHEILAEARKMAEQLEGDAVTLRVNPEVARALKSREGVILAELESALHKNVIVKSDAAVHQERFEIY